MNEQLKVLIIETYGIDIAYEVEDGLIAQGSDVVIAKTNYAAYSAIQNQTFDVILINMEPDGQGGISGLNFLHEIIESAHLQDSVCYGVSAQPGISVLTSNPEFIDDLSMLVGWLVLPLNTSKAAKLINDSGKFKDRLAIRARRKNTKKLTEVA